MLGWVDARPKKLNDLGSLSHASGQPEVGLGGALRRKNNGSVVCWAGEMVGFQLNPIQYPTPSLAQSAEQSLTA